MTQLLSVFVSLPRLSPSMQGTVYEKTNAEVEMKKINREEFWEQAKVGVEEERRRKRRKMEGRKERKQFNPASLVKKAKL